MKNDWIVANIENQGFTPDEFKAIGLTTADTQLLPMEEYLKSNYIIENPLFRGNDGTFSKDKFEKFYKEQLPGFQNFSQDVNEFQFDLFDTSRKATSKVKNPNMQLYQVSNPSRRTTGIAGRNEVREGEFTAKELAQQSKIYDTATGKYLDTSVNDNSLFKNPIAWISQLWKDPVVYATWDDDGTHTDPITGQTVSHKKGEFRVNESGDYFTETLGGRNIRGKQIVSVLDNITEDTSYINKYDFFDTDGFEQSVSGSIFGLAAQVAPLFIPYVGEIYSATLISRELSKALPMLSSMLDGVLGTNLENNSIINTIAAKGEQFTKGTTQYSQEKTLTLENLTNLIGDVATQWGQQKLIAQGIAKLKGTDKLIGKAYASAEAEYSLRAELMQGRFTPDDYKKLVGVSRYDEITQEWMKTGEWMNSAIGKSLKAKYIDKATETAKQLNRLGADASLAYMAIISNTDVYESLLDHGVTKGEAALFTLGSVLGMYGVDKYTGLGEVFFDELADQTGKYMPNNIEKLMNPWLQKLSKKGEIAITSDGKQSTSKIIQWGKEFGENYVNKYLKGFSGDLRHHTTRFLGKALGEGLEEVSEELVTDFTKVLYEQLGSIGITSQKDVGSFENWKERYGMSLLGGALGGGIFYGVGAIRGDYPLATEEQGIEYHIRDGKIKDYLKKIDEWEEKGKFGSKTLSTQLAEDGKTYLTTDDENQSINHYIAERVRNAIIELDGIIRGNNLNLTDDQLFENMVMSEKRFLDLKDWLKDEAYGTNYYQIYQQLVDKIVKAEDDLAKAEKTKSGTVDDKEMIDDEWKKNNKDTDAWKLREEKLQALRDKRDLLLKQKDDFLNGDSSFYYTRKLLFALDPILRQSFAPVKFDQWLKQKKNIDDPENLTKLDRVEYTKEYWDYLKDRSKQDLTDAFNSFLELEKKIAPILMGLEGTDEEFIKAEDAIKEIFRTTTDKEGNEIVPLLEQFEHLRNSMGERYEGEDEASYKKYIELQEKRREDATSLTAEDLRFINEREDAVQKKAEETREKIKKQIIEILQGENAKLDPDSYRRIVLQMKVPFGYLVREGVNQFLKHALEQEDWDEKTVLSDKATHLLYLDALNTEEDLRTEQQKQLIKEHNELVEIHNSQISGLKRLLPPLLVERIKDRIQDLLVYNEDGTNNFQEVYDSINELINNYNSETKRTVSDKHDDRLKRINKKLKSAEIRLGEAILRKIEDKLSRGEELNNIEKNYIQFNDDGTPKRDTDGKLITIKDHSVNPLFSFLEQIFHNPEGFLGGFINPDPSDPYNPDSEIFVKTIDESSPDQITSTISLSNLKEIINILLTQQRGDTVAYNAEQTERLLYIRELFDNNEIFNDSEKVELKDLIGQIDDLIGKYGDKDFYKLKEDFLSEQGLVPDDRMDEVKAALEQLLGVEKASPDKKEEVDLERKTNLRAYLNKNPDLEFIKELQKIGKISNPITKLISQIANALGVEKLDEELELIYNSMYNEHPDNFTITPQQIEKFHKLAEVLEIANAYLYSASQMATMLTPYGHNHTINELQKSGNKLPEIDKNTALIYQIEANKLLEELNWMITESSRNFVKKELKFIKAKEKFTDVKLEFINKLIREQALKFSVGDGDDIEEVDLFEGVDEIDPNLTDETKLSLIEEILFVNFNKIAKKYGINEIFNKSDILSTILADDSGTSLKFNRQQSGKLDENLTYKDFTSYDRTVYLLNVFALNSRKWAEHMQTEINDNDEIVPLTIQQYCSRLVTGFLNNTNVYIKALEYIQRKGISELSEFAVLTKSMFLSGIGGAGKTQVGAKYAVDYLIKQNPDLKILITGSTDKVRQNIKGVIKVGDIIDDPHDSQGTLGIIKKAIGEETYKKIMDDLAAIEKGTKTKSDYFTITVRRRDKEKIIVLNKSAITFNTDAAPDIIVLDEATHISSVELQILDSWAKQGVILIGDQSQSGYEGIGRSLDFENTFLFRTPKLGISLRDNNLQNLINCTTIADLLEDIKKLDETLPASEYEKIAKNIIEKRIKKLKVRGHLGSVVNGTIYTRSIDDKILDKIDKNNSVGYLGAKTSPLFEKLKEKFGDKLQQFDSIRDIQGQEFAYVFTDQNFLQTYYNNLSGENYHDQLIDYYSILRDFYTFISRAKVASIIEIKGPLPGKNELDKVQASADKPKDYLGRFKEIELKLLEEFLSTTPYTGEETAPPATSPSTPPTTPPATPPASGPEGGTPPPPAKLPTPPEGGETPPPSEEGTPPPADDDSEDGTPPPSDPLADKEEDETKGETPSESGGNEEGGGEDEGPRGEGGPIEPEDKNKPGPTEEENTFIDTSDVSNGDAMPMNINGETVVVSTTPPKISPSMHDPDKLTSNLVTASNVTFPIYTVFTLVGAHGSLVKDPKTGFMFRDWRIPNLDEDRRDVEIFMRSLDGNLYPPNASEESEEGQYLYSHLDGDDHYYLLGNSLSSDLNDESKAAIIAEHFKIKTQCEQLLNFLKIAILKNYSWSLAETYLGNFITEKQFKELKENIYITCEEIDSARDIILGTKVNVKSKGENEDKRLITAGTTSGKAIKMVARTTDKDGRKITVTLGIGLNAKDIDAQTAKFIAAIDENIERIKTKLKQDISEAEKEEYNRLLEKYNKLKENASTENKAYATRINNLEEDIKVELEDYRNVISAIEVIGNGIDREERVFENIAKDEAVTYSNRAYIYLGGLPGVDESLIGKVVTFGVSDPLANPEDLMERYTAVKKSITNLEEQYDMVRMLVLSGRGVHLNDLNWVTQSRIFGQLVDENNSLNVSWSEIGIKLFGSAWNFRASLINFNEQYKEFIKTLIDDGVVSDEGEFLRLAEKYIPTRTNRDVDGNLSLQTRKDGRGNWVSISGKDKDKVVKIIEGINKFNQSLAQNNIRWFRLGFRTLENGKGSQHIVPYGDQKFINIHPKAAKDFESVINKYFSDIVGKIEGIKNPTNTNELLFGKDKDGNIVYSNIRGNVKKNRTATVDDSIINISDKDDRTFSYSSNGENSTILGSEKDFIKLALATVRLYNKFTFNQDSEISNIITLFENSEDKTTIKIDNIVEFANKEEGNTKIIGDLLRLMVHGTVVQSNNWNNSDGSKKKPSEVFSETYKASDAYFRNGIFMNPIIPQNVPQNQRNEHFILCELPLWAYTTDAVIQFPMMMVKEYQEKPEEQKEVQIVSSYIKLTNVTQKPTLNEIKQYIIDQVISNIFDVNDVNDEFVQDLRSSVNGYEYEYLRDKDITEVINDEITRLINKVKQSQKDISSLDEVHYLENGKIKSLKEKIIQSLSERGKSLEEINNILNRFKLDYNKDTDCVILQELETSVTISFNVNEGTIESFILKSNSDIGGNDINVDVDYSGLNNDEDWGRVSFNFINNGIDLISELETLVENLNKSKNITEFINILEDFNKEKLNGWTGQASEDSNYLINGVVSIINQVLDKKYNKQINLGEESTYDKYTKELTKISQESESDPEC